MNDVLARLEEMRANDLPTHGGRTLAYVYDSGLAEADELGQAAVAAFASSNGLDPTAFPSLLRMENELVGIACDLLGAPASAVGTVTSGGTESILLAVQAARDAHPEIESPSMVLPSTVHAAFLKAAHYFGVRPVVVPADSGYRADVAATEAAIDESCVLVVASAPSYAHGVVDPVAGLAALAMARGIRCHVDACIGGWVLPYAARLGRDVPAWTFDVEGVTSISVDLHKYAYTPKGASVLLHRTPALRKPQFFARADWPGYTMLNSTTQSTKSGGPLAAAWAVVNRIGDDGYLRLTEQVLDGMDRLLAGLVEIPALACGRRPGLDAGRAGDRRVLRRVHDRRRDARGRLVRPAAAHPRRPPTDPAPDPECGDRPARRGVPDHAGLRGRHRLGGRARRGGSRHRRLRPGARPDRPLGRGLRRPARRSRHGRLRRRAPPCSPSGWPRSTRCSTWPPPRSGRPS